MHTHWMADNISHKDGLLLHPPRIQSMLYDTRFSTNCVMENRTPPITHGRLGRQEEIELQTIFSCNVINSNNIT